MQLTVNGCFCVNNVTVQNGFNTKRKIIIIIIIERKDLGGVMSKDCKDTLQTLKTETKHQCDAK